MASVQVEIWFLHFSIQKVHSAIITNLYLLSPHQRSIGIVVKVAPLKATCGELVGRYLTQSLAGLYCNTL
jgi:hypothetical protein